MKKILITSRIIERAINDEKHFSLDIRWLDFLTRCKLLPIIVPPNLKILKYIIDTSEYHGILLSGGGNIAELGGMDHDRDIVENYLIKKSISNGIPLMGICRGMQKIQAHFGEKNFEHIDNNIAKSQPAIFDFDQFEFLKGKRKYLININSYHHYGVRNNSLINFKIPVTSESGIIKAIKHNEKKIMGIMWHPERESHFKEIDLKIFREFYGK